MISCITMLDMLQYNSSRRIWVHKNVYTWKRQVVSYAYSLLVNSFKNRCLVLDSDTILCKVQSYVSITGNAETTTRTITVCV